MYIENPTNDLVIEGNDYKYLFKVRRFDKNALIKVRNLKDDFLFVYEIAEIQKKKAFLKLKEKIKKPNKPKKFTHIAWCVIDPKNVEKTLPSLNEMGLSKLTLVYCDYSQKNFKIKPERIKKILINSSQQCGRSDILEIETINSSEEFFEKYPDFTALDFGGEPYSCQRDYPMPVIIGPEGGFSEKERRKFKKTISLEGFVLRSETAVCSICAKIIL